MLAPAGPDAGAGPCRPPHEDDHRGPSHQIQQRKRDAQVNVYVQHRGQDGSDALETERATAEAVPALPRLHPNLVKVYCERVIQLRDSLRANAGPEVLEAVRSLIDRVEVHAPVEANGKPRLELVGHLSAMLHFAGAGYEKAPCLVAWA